MTFKKGISIVLGILFVIWGIYTFGKGVKGVGDIEAYTGKLHILSGAEDTDFDIYVDSPVLVRDVQMYQYVSDSRGYGAIYPNAPIVGEDDDSYIKTAFSSSYQPGMTGKEILTGLKVDFKNPPFPKEIKSKVFCGEVSIGDEGILLNNEVIEKLSYKSYDRFNSETQLYPVGGLAGGEDVLGLSPYDDFTYLSGDGEDLKIGDIKVTWYTINPAELKDEYTVAGIVSGNVLENSKRGGVLFYDYKRSVKEIKKEFNSSNTIIGIIIALVGLVCIAIPVALIYSGRKKG